MSEDDGVVVCGCVVCGRSIFFPGGVVKYSLCWRHR